MAPLFVSLLVAMTARLRQWLMLRAAIKRLLTPRSSQCTLCLSDMVRALAHYYHRFSFGVTCQRAAS